ncbi:MAG: hypothetical protein MJZ72_00890 [Bacteroidales bacterium]|nr:hypothetical protein [Bacteroidales bacterium]
MKILSKKTSTAIVGNARAAHRKNGVGIIYGFLPALRGIGNDHAVKLNPQFFSSKPYSLFPSAFRMGPLTVILRVVAKLDGEGWALVEAAEAEIAMWMNPNGLAILHFDSFVGALFGTFAATHTSSGNGKFRSILFLVSRVSRLRENAPKALSLVEIAIRVGRYFCDDVVYNGFGRFHDSQVFGRVAQVEHRGPGVGQDKRKRSVGLDALGGHFLTTLFVIFPILMISP